MPSPPSRDAGWTMPGKETPSSTWLPALKGPLQRREKNRLGLWGLFWAWSLCYLEPITVRSCGINHTQESWHWRCNPGLDKSQPALEGKDPLCHSLPYPWDQKSPSQPPVISKTSPSVQGRRVQKYGLALVLGVGQHGFPLSGGLSGLGYQRMGHGSFSHPGSTSSCLAPDAFWMCCSQFGSFPVRSLSSVSPS